MEVTKKCVFPDQIFSSECVAVQSNYQSAFMFNCISNFAVIAIMTKNTLKITNRRTLGNSLNDENLLSEEGKNIVEAIREDIKNLRV